MHINYLQEPQDSQAAEKALVALWVPSEKIISHIIEKPTAPKRKWLQLLPWLLEERLLEKTEDIHFVIAGENQDNNVEVLAINKQDMTSWQEQFSHANLNPRVLLPDYLALPWDENSISIAQREDALLVRLSMYSGFAAEFNTACTMLALIIQQDTERSIQLAQDVPLDSLPSSLHDLIKNRFTLDWHLAPSAPNANLLVGEYAVKPTKTGLKKWWPVAAIIILGLGFGFWYNSSLSDSNSTQPLARQQQSSEAEQSNLAGSVESNKQVNSPQQTQEAPTPPPRRPSNFKAELLGVVVNGELSSATIRIDGQPERVVHLNEELSQGITVHSISSNTIIVDDQGELLDFSLKKFDSLIQAVNQRSNQPLSGSEGFSMANMFAVVPVQVDNYNAGLKLDNLSDELRLLADISEGDIVVQVGDNGIQELMSNPALWTTFSTNTQLPVTIIRGGEEMIINVNAFSLSASVLPNLANEIMP